MARTWKMRNAVKRSLTFKDENGIAWQGPLCVTLVCLVLGIPFFFGFYYGMVVPEKDKLERTTAETCLITSINDGRYDCSKRSGCSCIGCGANPQCSTREGTVGDDGECCGSACCAHYTKQYYSCTKYVCYGCSGDDQCCHRWVYNGCSKKVCTQPSVDRCTVTWGDCWHMTVYYHLVEQPEQVRSFAHSCSYNDQACVNSIHAEYPTNKTKPCWLDPKHNSVSFSSPGDSDLKGGWVGAGFGIAFLSIAAIALCWGFWTWCLPRAKHKIDNWKAIQAEKRRKFQEQVKKDADAVTDIMREGLEHTKPTSSNNPSPAYGAQTPYGEPTPYQLPPPQNPAYPTSTEYVQNSGYTPRYPGSMAYQNPYGNTTGMDHPTM